MSRGGIGGLEVLKEALDHPDPALQWRPLPIRVPDAGTEAVTALCRPHGVEVMDTLDRQLSELARVRHPSSTEADLRHAFLAKRGPDGSHPYPGVWMYFAWIRRLVRVLEKDDFFEVVTSRNRDKITLEEQRLLRERTVGVVGLSVGGEIAVTVAQEHLCGKIKVADFDQLDPLQPEPTGLRRGRSGVQQGRPGGSADCRPGPLAGGGGIPRRVHGGQRRRIPRRPGPRPRRVRQPGPQAPPPRDGPGAAPEPGLRRGRAGHDQHRAPTGTPTSSPSTGSSPSPMVPERATPATRPSSRR